MKQFSKHGNYTALHCILYDHCTTNTNCFPNTHRLIIYTQLCCLVVLQLEHTVLSGNVTLVDFSYLCVVLYLQRRQESPVSRHKMPLTLVRSVAPFSIKHLISRAQIGSKRVSYLDL